MNQELKKAFYDKLDMDKIKINWNKRPIAMKLFLSFLTVDVERSHDHLGSSTGWTLLKNDKLGLKVKGGVYQNIELLDSLEYGKNLGNPYNNYVNPFYLFDIMTEEGKAFFAEYYKTDIEKIISDTELGITSLENQLSFKKDLLNKLIAEKESLFQKPQLSHT